MQNAPTEHGFFKQSDGALRIAVDQGKMEEVELCSHFERMNRASLHRSSADRKAACQTLFKCLRCQDHGKLPNPVSPQQFGKPVSGLCSKEAWWDGQRDTVFDVLGSMSCTAPSSWPGALLTTGPSCLGSLGMAPGSSLLPASPCRLREVAQPLGAGGCTAHQARRSRWEWRVCGARAHPRSTARAGNSQALLMSELDCSPGMTTYLQGEVRTVLAPCVLLMWQTPGSGGC
ncbi:uncharacterized protein LOC112944481 [Nothoprocta perdicaria]|uniref:uncharacterized protein LOC112944481 n=1 Tax=Nothoprocta perdicaria TaxID=30464 RepID=UPI000E1B9C26|nr:uncharacterized protein LOC112944481 [Nothoprocta perdicaria]